MVFHGKSHYQDLLIELVVRPKFLRIIEMLWWILKQRKKEMVGVIAMVSWEQTSDLTQMEVNQNLGEQFADLTKEGNFK